VYLDCPSPAALCRYGPEPVRPRETRQRLLEIMKALYTCLALALGACAPQDPNPLIAASDDQFLKTVGNLTFLGCDRCSLARTPRRLTGRSAMPANKACSGALQMRAFRPR
jgi:hypothetical protein